jgi:hypothetical protein
MTKGERRLVEEGEARAVVSIFDMALANALAGHEERNPGGIGGRAVQSDTS